MTPIASLSALSQSNRRLKVALAAVVLCLTLHAHGAELLPSAPTPVHAPAVFAPIDLGLASSVVLTRALDWTSTRECLRRSWCREAELPNALVHNKAEFAAFELAMSGVSIAVQYELIRHNHRKLARVGQAIDVGIMGGTVIRNYHLVTTAPVAMGLRPIR